MEGVLKYTGVIASVWIVIGIYLASRFYPGYSHSRQFCSELGASGSPTQKLSPAINNYPLGILFISFGLYLITDQNSEVSSIIIGGMVATHGLCTWICGFFPMDADPYTENPSCKSKIHSLSGVVMLVSFIIAPAVVILSSAYPYMLRIISFLCIAGCFFFSYKLAIAFKKRTNPGLHQRLSYGFQIMWLFVFSIFVIS